MSILGEGRNNQCQWTPAFCEKCPLRLCFQGDGLEFKRHFVKIKQKLSDIISTQKIT